VPWDDWIRTVEIEPSLYAADFAHLGEQVDVLLRTGARIFHWDVGDGHFVEPITMGPIVLHSIAPLVHGADGVVDVHLMTETPEKYFHAFAAAGGDSVTVHYEAVEDLPAAVRAAREQELQIGMAVKPATRVEEAAEAASAAGVDFVLCMSVEPGYSGQKFIPDAIDRLKKLRELLPARMHLQVDGGIDSDNVRRVYEAGANLIVAASAIFEREDLTRAYRRLVQALA
jgi:ribulose-phosphate 3-epimerase